MKLTLALFAFAAAQAPTPWKAVGNGCAEIKNGESIDAVSTGPFGRVCFESKAEIGSYSGNGISVTLGEGQSCDGFCSKLAVNAGCVEIQKGEIINKLNVGMYGKVCGPEGIETKIGNLVNNGIVTGKKDCTGFCNTVDVNAGCLEVDKNAQIHTLNVGYYGKVCVPKDLAFPIQTANNKGSSESLDSCDGYCNTLTVNEGCVEVKNTDQYKFINIGKYGDVCVPADALDTIKVTDAGNFAKLDSCDGYCNTLTVNEGCVEVKKTDQYKFINIGKDGDVCVPADARDTINVTDAGNFAALDSCKGYCNKTCAKDLMDATIALGVLFGLALIAIVALLINKPKPPVPPTPPPAPVQYGKTEPALYGN